MCVFLIFLNDWLLAIIRYTKIGNGVYVLLPVTYSTKCKRGYVKEVTYSNGK